jgi:AI-2 transport protein TqsA
MEQFTQSRLLVAALWFIIIFITGYALAIAQKLLIPLVLALFLWYLVNMLADQFGRIRLGSWMPPGWLQYLLSGFVLLLILVLILNIITDSISALVASASDYQDNLVRLISDLRDSSRLFAMIIPIDPVSDINFEEIVRSVAANFGNILASLVLIAIYMFFLFMEQRYMAGKLAAVSASDKQSKKLSKLLKEIDHDIQIYLGVKTFVSLVTAVISWGIMWLVGLEFAAFWALLIFVLNFIPNIGSIIATLFPGFMALIQFETLTPVLIVLFGVGTVQFMIGNILEPNLMGKSLNISPLVIIISLVAWGVMWGIAGMFLSIPITMVAILIMYNFENTRWIALLLSRDGKLKYEIE